MSSVLTKILNLTRQLLPTGRAFQYPEGGELEKFHTAMAKTEESAYNDATSTLYSILPDNDNFTTEDAARWEERLGMITNSNVSLADRKSAIIRKMNHPGDIPARQSWDFLQQSLQLAGFDVYIHESIPDQTIDDVVVSALNIGEMGEPEMGEIEMGNVESYYGSVFQATEMGEPEMGQPEMGGYTYNHLIANEITESHDPNFVIGENYRSTFYIGGEIKGTFANVSIDRKNEFRQLILRIKPVHSIGVLLINYV